MNSVEDQADRKDGECQGVLAYKEQQHTYQGGQVKQLQDLVLRERHPDNVQQCPNSQSHQEQN